MTRHKKDVAGEVVLSRVVPHTKVRSMEGADLSIAINRRICCKEEHAKYRHCLGRKAIDLGAFYCLVVRLTKQDEKLVLRFFSL